MTGEDGQRPKEHKERRLNQHAVDRFPIRSHPFKGAPCIKCCKDHHEPAKGQQIGKGNNIKTEGEERRTRTKRHECASQEDGHKGDGRCQTKHYACCSADHSSFFKEADTITNVLKESGTLTSTEETLCPADDADEQERYNEHKRHGDHRTSASVSTTTAMMKTKAYMMYDRMFPV